MTKLTSVSRNMTSIFLTTGMALLMTVLVATVNAQTQPFTSDDVTVETASLTDTVPVAIDDSVIEKELEDLASKVYGIDFSNQGEEEAIEDTEQAAAEQHKFKVKNQLLNTEQHRELFSRYDEQSRLNYQIDPALHAVLRDAQTKVSESGIPWVGLGVNTYTNTLDIKIDSEHNFTDIVRRTVGPDIPVNITYGPTNVVLQTCDGKDSRCDPLRGGVLITNENGNPCTLSFPVTRTNPWLLGTEEHGYIIPAHCAQWFESVYQPINDPNVADNNRIGYVADRNFGGDCDCAFLIETGERTAQNWIYWGTAAEYLIINFFDSLPGDWVIFTGSLSGNDYGKVILTDYEAKLENEITGEQVQVGGLTVVSSIHSQPGDSGAPMSSPAHDAYIGMHVASESILDTDTGEYEMFSYVIPWSNLERNLGL